MIQNFVSLSHFWRKYVPAYKSGSHSDVFVRFPWNDESRRIAKSIRAISERRSTNRTSSYIRPEEIERVRKRLGNRDNEKSKSRIQHRKDEDDAILRDYRLTRTSGSRYVDARNTGFSGIRRNADEKGNRKTISKPARDVSIRFGVSKKGHGYGKERGDFCLVSAVLVGKKITFFYRSIELIGGFAFDLVLIEELERLLGVEFTQIDIWAKKAFIFALKGNSNQKLYPKLREIIRRAS